MKTSDKARQFGSRNPEQTRKRILSAALREFAAHGYAGARVDVIAVRAKINKRMLYHYFGDKQGLFREVLRLKMAERAAWMSSAPENPLDALPHWFELVRSDPDWIRLLQFEALQWRETKVIDEDRRRDVCERIIEKFKALQRAGALPADLDAAQLLLSLVALTAYPFAFPQISRTVTGLRVSDPEFTRQRTEFLRVFAGYLRGREEKR